MGSTTRPASEQLFWPIWVRTKEAAIFDSRDRINITYVEIRKIMLHTIYINSFIDIVV
jgi:hypothetical protein